VSLVGPDGGCLSAVTTSTGEIDSEVSRMQASLSQR
jgi:hypothetical protein